MHRLSEEGEIIGSISYRAPELLRGRLDSSDHRPCDVYSLGRILWALIWGKEPHNLTDLEFQELTINDCGHPIRKPQTLDDIIKGATNTNPKFRLDIHKFILFLENWLKDSPAESAAAIISKIENSDAVMQKLKAKTITDEIYVLHDGMTNHINATMEELLKEWRAIADPLKAKGVGNGVDIMAGSGGALSDTAPKLMGITLPDRANQYVFRMRMSLGVALPDLFDLAIYMYINFDDFSGQEYFIIPVHIPSDQIPPNISPELLGEVIYRKFDYRDADIKQQIIIDLQNAFEPMDKRFRDKLKRKQVN
jgi:serine/threonine protein kinase